ncbi:MFS transporter [Lactiplantibacillus pentosus]|uniref:MFS transporter n=1 Tax=Lactiplantibacillus pentosus TaxID=1589 RepID=UPI001ADDDF7B|nr:MFS transporter [Lactiplantibacillus pentosus]MBO9165879.1 MFS transporter [Lactiplantibacillus pentosus]MCT3310278.1 MFS transporter [Lactiplantibacillus pentosus]WFC02030.1 MFS transporter [Lactiplantibacillus pentosus]
MQATTTLTRNFRILWFGSLITDLGNAMTLPFIVLYIQTLGHYSTTQLNLLGAAAFAVTYACKALVAPLWGRLADQKGRKLMCLRASGMMTLTILGVGLAPNVTILLILRAAQGAFSGYINNANALISLTAPAERRGQWLSKLVTGSISGTLMGPLLGSVLANTVGYRGAFIVTSGLMAMVFVMTLWGVQEDVTPVRRQALAPLRPILKQIGGVFIMALLTSLLVVQATTNAVTPILSLFVMQLAPQASSHTIVLLTGLVAAAPGVATILMAGRIGRLIDRLGAGRCLLIFLGLAISDLILTSLVQQVGQLIILRLILGIADAALLPALQVMTVERVPQVAFGRVFSLNQSAQACGNVVGPGLAVLVANQWGYQPIFLVTASLQVIALGLWGLYFHQQPGR